MIVDGAIVAVIGNAVSNAGYGIGGALAGFGVLALFFGFVVLVSGIYLYFSPDQHVGVGIAIVILSLLSLIGGGGFVIGLILGVIGGILAIVFEPETDLWDDDFLPPRPPVPGRTCPSCGQPVTPGLTNCARCGAVQP
jgi:hypothetical protein